MSYSQAVTLASVLAVAIGYRPTIGLAVTIFLVAVLMPPGRRCAWPAPRTFETVKGLTTPACP